MSWIIIFACLFGLIMIYFNQYKVQSRNQRIKVKAVKPMVESFDTKQPVAKRNDGLNWKRPKLDYKEIADVFNKAETFYSKKDYENAKKTYINVLTLHPLHPGANNKLGLIYLKEGRASKAEVIFRKLVEIKPHEAVYYSNLGLALYSLGHKLEAKQAYTRAIKLDPKKDSRFLSLGQVCVDLKHWKPAINAFSKALELNPKNDKLYFYIADLLIKVQAYNEAMAFMKTYLNMNPYSKEAKDKIREIKIKSGASPLNVDPRAELKKDPLDL
ncbi:tetratricopeptide repeat protein [bacterium]|jgi:tetratricopeptide (TPR) repeat protein|nr:tetratricopeptide repeat protein [bacterium]